MVKITSELRFRAMPEGWNEADQDDSPKIDVEPYRKLVGSVLFILKSRPDVAIALSKE